MISSILFEFLYVAMYGKHGTSGSWAVSNKAILFYRPCLRPMRTCCMSSPVCGSASASYWKSKDVEVCVHGHWRWRIYLFWCAPPSLPIDKHIHASAWGLEKLADIIDFLIEDSQKQHVHYLAPSSNNSKAFAWMHQIKGCYPCDGPSACTRWIQCSFLPCDKRNYLSLYIILYMLDKSAPSNRQRTKRTSQQANTMSVSRENEVYGETTSSADTYLCTKNLSWHRCLFSSHATWTFRRYACCTWLRHSTLSALWIIRSGRLPCWHATSISRI